MFKATRSIAALLLVLAACSSKKDDHAATASGTASGSASGSAPAPTPTPPPTPPAPPPDAGPDMHGVELHTETDHVAVVDPVGGFRIDLPFGQPEVETDDTDSPGVHVSITNGDDVLGVKINRLSAKAVDHVDVNKVYKQTVEAMTKAGFAITQQDLIKMGGMPAMQYTGTKSIQDTPVTVRTWMIEVPSTATLYQLVIATPAAQDPPPGWQQAIDSFRAAK